MRTAMALSGLALLALSACGKPAANTEARSASAPVAAVAAAPTLGPAVSCLGLRQIRESRVRSDQVIDFVTVGGETYRNTLPYKCPQLGFERAFSYSTSLNQLCSTDIITVVVQGGGISRGPSCGLGQFTPISAEMAKAELPR